MGGPVVSVSALAEEIVRRGHEVLVVTSNANLDQDLEVPLDRYVDVEGVKVRYFRREEPLKKLFPNIPYLAKSSGVVYTRGMQSELRRVVPTVDVVHTHLPFVYPTLAAGRAAIRFEKPLFYHQRGVLDPQRLRFRAIKKALYLRGIELPILKKASMLFALTTAEEASYRRLGLKNPCRVVPNGIDATRAQGMPDRALLREQGIDDGDVVVLFLGRIHPIKGADKLLDAFIRVAPRFPAAKLVLAGPDEFGLEAAFRARADSAGVRNRVVFPGMVHGDLKWSLLASAKLFVLPSDAEGFSIAVLEAMASSTAVLLSPGCNFPEVDAEGAGVVCAPHEAVISSQLEGLLSDIPRIEHMGRVGRSIVVDRYGWGRIADQTIDAYREGIDRYRLR